MGEAAPKEKYQQGLSGGSSGSGSAGGSSMEDILASIRKIITSDDAHGESSQPMRRGEPTFASEPARPSAEVEKKMGPLSALAAALKAPKPDTGKENASEAPPNAGTAQVEAKPLRSMPQAQTPSSTPGGLAALASKVRAAGEPPASSIRESSLAATPKNEFATNTEQAALRSGTVPEQTVAEPQSARRAMTLAEVAALASGQEQGAKTEPVADAMKAKAMEVTTAAPNPEAAPAAVSEEVETTQSEVFDAVKPATTPQRREEDMQVATEPAANSPETATVVEEPAASKAEEDAFREALVSPSTHAAVSSSIGRLKKSVADVDAAHFEAVLRPMLREWMDENLPSLVERIVRDEISAISRDAAEAAE